MSAKRNDAGQLGADPDLKFQEKQACGGTLECLGSPVL
jgi:hypothetical protein